MLLSVRVLTLALFCGGVLLFPIVTLASTTVPGGTISTDTTWSMAGSPYIVMGDLLIQGTNGPDGVTTLVIEPGVVVRTVPSFRSISVGQSAPGALVANGSENQGVVFTAHTATPVPGSWEGLLFLGQASGTSALHHTVVEYAGGGSSTETIRLSTAAAVSVELDNVTVRNGTDYGIRVTSGTLEIHDSVFENIANFDIRLDNSSSITGSVVTTTLESVQYVGPNPNVLWTGNQFVNWGATRSQLEPDVVGPFSSSNDFFPVTNAVTDVLLEVPLTIDSTWTTAPGAYRVGRMNIEGTAGPDNVTTLNLSPGVVLRVQPSFYWIRVGQKLRGRDGIRDETARKGAFSDADNDIVFRDGVFETWPMSTEP